MSNESHAGFHNGSNDDYFIIKELANEFEGKFGKIQKKISVWIENEIKNIVKNGNDSIGTISY